MTDWYLALTPLLVLVILLLFRFVGCNQIYGLNPTMPFPPTLTLEWVGINHDQVGPGKLALAPDGHNDGTLTATVNLIGGGTVTGLILFSEPHGGVWDTNIQTPYFVLGVSQTLDGPLLNDSTTAAVNFFVAESGTFVIYGSDLNDQEFLPLNKLTLLAFFADGSTASAQVDIPEVT